MGINDMSLEWGGVFDIHGGWNLETEHAFHRVGLSVDIDNRNRLDLNDSLKVFDAIRTAALRAQGNTRDIVRKWSPRGEELMECLESFGGAPWDENTVHFGIRKGN
jgi:hypothetical protein